MTADKQLLAEYLALPPVPKTFIEDLAAIAAWDGNDEYCLSEAVAIFKRAVKDPNAPASNIPESTEKENRVLGEIILNITGGEDPALTPPRTCGTIRKAVSLLSDANIRHCLSIIAIIRDHSDMFPDKKLDQLRRLFVQSVTAGLDGRVG